jgi:hypothetical protein
VFVLPDSWTWDFWLADDGERFHLFFLFASRALADPEERHRRASVGHAVSTDLHNWTRVADAVVRSETPACDDVATWTGSVVRDDDGTWWMFYTGCNDHPAPGTQRITAATSTDLMSWTKVDRTLTSADPRWYETVATSNWRDESWRDPWVWRAADGRWHMFVTARGLQGDVYERAVVGHAMADSLGKWEILPPVSAVDAGFGQIEVVQPVIVDGQHYVVFSCLSPDMAPRLREAAGTGGVWIAPGNSELGPWDIDRAHRITDDRAYAGRVITDRAGIDQFLAFALHDADRAFKGGLLDPVPFVDVVNGRLLTATHDLRHDL